METNMKLPANYILLFLPDVGWDSKDMPANILMAVPINKLDKHDYLGERLTSYYNDKIENLEAIEVTPTRFKTFSKDEKRKIKTAPFLFVKPDDTVRLVPDHNLVTERTKRKPTHASTLVKELS
jgi:hypothetical protein